MKRLSLILAALTFTLAVVAQKPNNFKVKSILETNLYKVKGERKAHVTLTLDADAKLSKAEILDSINNIVQTTEIDNKKKVKVNVSEFVDGTHKVAVYSSDGGKQIFMIKKIAHSK